jgi:hypothetical protein
VQAEIAFVVRFCKTQGSASAFNRRTLLPLSQT